MAKHSLTLNRPLLLLLAVSLMLMIFIPCSHEACTGASTIESNTCSFNEYTNNRAFGAITGKVTWSTYWYISVSSPYNTAIVKINSDNTKAWVSTFNFYINPRRFEVDSAEQFIYFGKSGSPPAVLKLQTSDGALVDAQVL